MVLYTTVGVSDLAVSVAFYDAVLGVLGHVRTVDAADGWAGWGPSYDEGVSFWICRPFDGEAPNAGNGNMIAFRAQSAEAVRAFYAAALHNGGHDEGAPGVRNSYGPNFYVCYARDPDGNKLACVFHNYNG